MTISYLSLGSNLDNPSHQLHMAIKEISETFGCVLVKCSSFYQTKAIGPEQPDFLNMVIKIKTTLSPADLLTAMQAIENNHARKRLIHWGPRTLDIDILLYGQSIIETDKLTIPHPYMHKRGFVLVPLYELEPTLSLPKGNSIHFYLQHIDHLDGIKQLQEPIL